MVPPEAGLGRTLVRSYRYSATHPDLLKQNVFLNSPRPGGDAFYIRNDLASTQAPVRTNFGCIIPSLGGAATSSNKELFERGGSSKDANYFITPRNLRIAAAPFFPSSTASTTSFPPFTASPPANTPLILVE
jgi:hypothetical protein